MQLHKIVIWMLKREPGLPVLSFKMCPSIPLYAGNVLSLSPSRQSIHCKRGTKRGFGRNTATSFLAFWRYENYFQTTEK
jgi:hypothetical protein